MRFQNMYALLKRYWRGIEEILAFPRNLSIIFVSGDSLGCTEPHYNAAPISRINAFDDAQWHSDAFSQMCRMPTLGVRSCFLALSDRSPEQKFTRLLVLPRSNEQNFRSSLERKRYDRIDLAHRASSPGEVRVKILEMTLQRLFRTHNK